MSGNVSSRSAQLRKISCLVLAVCLLNIGWSWPFSKKNHGERGTGNGKRQPVVETHSPLASEEILTSDGKGYRQSASPAEQKSEAPVLEITRSDDAASYVTRSVTVVGQEEIKNSTARYVPELLKSKAGIVVTDQSGNPKGLTVDIRGFGDTANRNVLVLVDGRRVNPMDISGPNWAAIPLETVERVEVIRGPSSVLYGDNAAGGVINIVTKKAGAGVHAKTEAEVGLHQYKRAGATVSASNDWAQGLFHFENTQDGGWRANTDYWANDWFGKLGIGPFEGAGLDLSAGHHRDRNGLPGALFIGNIDQIGREGTRFPGDHTWSEETFFTAEPRWNFEWAENGFELSGFNSFRRKQSKAVYPSSQDAKNDIDAYEFQPKISWTRQLNDWIRSKMTTGLDFFLGKNDIQSAKYYGGGNPELADITKKSLGVYILENLSFWDKFLLNLGFRGEWTKYNFNERESVWNQDTSSMRNAAFDFGTGFKYNERSLAYFDVSRSFRMPATDEFYSMLSNAWGGGGLNAGLNQQQEMSYELGVRENTFKPLNLGMSVFLSDIKDEIFYDPSGGGGWGANANYASPTRRIGFETESSVKFYETHWYNITPFFNLTAQKPYFKGGNYSGKRIPLVPDFKYATGFVLSPVKGLTFSTELNHLGSQFAINDEPNNAPKLKAYTTVDMKVRYNWRWATVWISLTDLFNSKYSEYATYGFNSSTSQNEVAYYPAQGRNFVAGFSLEY